VNIHRLPTPVLEELLDRAEVRLRQAHGRVTYDCTDCADPARAPG
jgi:hypothetical protein